MAVEKKKPEAAKAKGVVYKALDLKLPTEDSIPETNMARFSYFIYGKQGIGKTTLSLQFPHTLHMMFEPGAKSKALRKVEPNNWKEVEEYTRLLEGDDQYQTVAIDTSDLMWDMCVKHVCEEKGVDYLKDIGFGDGYAIAGTKFRNVLIKLHKHKGLVILAHEKVGMKQRDDDPDYILPSSPKRCTETVSKWVDFAGRFYITSANKRYMRIRANNQCEAKCRPDEFFNYTDGKPMLDIPMGNNPAESYTNFEKSFKNQLENPKAKAKEKTESKFKIG